jgi:hypothetical protein
MSRDVMKLALEALETERPYLGPMPTKTSKAITALREALAEQPAQKCSYPYCGCNSKAWCKVERNEALDKMAENARELGLDYEPVQQEPLTDEQIDRLWSQSLADTEGETYLPLREFARAIEAKLKEKNT